MIRAGLLTTVLLAAAAPALADPAKDAAPRPARSCFSLSDWDGWSAPDKNTLLMKVRNRDVYKVELSHGTSQLTSPGVHLVSVVRGIMPIRAKTITRLTTEQIAAIPKKDRP
jgi:hypothetical protein